MIYFVSIVCLFFVRGAASAFGLSLLAAVVAGLTQPVFLAYVGGFELFGPHYGQMAGNFMLRYLPISFGIVFIAGLAIRWVRKLSSAARA